MWTTENRPRYDRDRLRYPSVLTDAEWQHIGPLIPSAKRGGGRRTVKLREVVNGVMYVLSTGCQWRYIPKELPPRSSVNGSGSRRRHPAVVLLVRTVPIPAEVVRRQRLCRADLQDGTPSAPW
jgi:transposase